MAPLLACRLGLAAAAALLMAQPAWALFEDDEARKAILDLRARLAQNAQNDEAQKARIAELGQANAQLLEQIATLRRSLLDLNNQLELIRTDLARLRGTDEQTQRELAELQKRQRDLGQAVDERVRKLEPVRVTLDGREFSAEPEERKAYEEAVALMRGGDFDRAAPALAAFLRRYPGSGYADSARYWLGNAQYATRGYKEAIVNFRIMLTATPDHVRAPEAMLSIANCQIELKDVAGARKTLDELARSYPQSDAAKAGKERLARLR